MRTVLLKKNCNFTPEYSNAVRVLLSTLGSSMKASAVITPEILYEGNIQKISRTFHAREIPAGDSWRWNQTKARKEIQLDNSVRVEFFKLSPRRKGPMPKDIPLPQMKLWQFKVITLTGEYYLLWCERGNSQSVNLKDFSFLAPFMEDSTLVEQLWPREDIYYL